MATIHQHHHPDQQQNYIAPTCEDYHSDDSAEDHVLESFRRTPPAAGQANVAAKRSHPSDLGASGKSPAQEKVPVNIDLQSDSGYSSHTAATMSSADSAPSAKSSHSPPIRPASVAAPSSMPPPSPASTAMRRRPTNAADDRKSSQSSPRKPLQRTGSVSSRRPKGTKSTATEECTVPNCECGQSSNKTVPSSSRPRRPTKSSALDSGLDISYAPFEQRSQRSDPAPSSFAGPPSPTYTRQPMPYQQGSALVQPAQTRRRSSSTTRRPMSYHGHPGQDYWVPGMAAPPFTPSTPQEHSHPLTMAARYNMQHAQQMPSYPGGPPTPGGYFSNGQMPQHDMRPPMRGSMSNYGPRNTYGPAVVTQDRNQYSARYPSAPQSARQERFPQFQDEETSESDEYSSEEEERPSRNSRALVSRKTSNEVAPRRPSLRHANTQPVSRRLSQSQAPPLERPLRERDPRASRVSTAAPSRAPSTTRPALIQHPKAQSYETSRDARVVVENPRSRRRQSYQGYENKVYDKVYDKVYTNQTYDTTYDKEYIKEQKRRNRDSKIYRDDRDDRDERVGEQGIVPLSSNRRRQTDRDARMRDESIAESNKRTVMDAEAYQQRVRGSYDPNEHIYKAAKKASRMPAGAASENGSSRSKGSDRASRASQSNRTTVTSGGANGEIRLRVDPSAPLTLSFNGDMEGRTLQINPAEDGMADIVIGNSRGNENQYRSERGSVFGPPRKAIMANQARREAEEQSVKSSRSSHGRRDGERRPLRRRDIEYN